MPLNSQDQNFLNKIAFLESKQRERLMAPEKLVAQLPIEPYHDLLDIGAGSGFFTTSLAEMTTGSVYAMDPDPRMLKVIEAKAVEKGLQNIISLEETIETISLPENSIHFALASLILHEVKDLNLALEQIAKVITPGGHLLCVEYEKDELLLEGPPMAIRLQSDELIKSLISAGFDLVKKTRITEAVYTILAVKK